MAEPDGGRWQETSNLAALTLGIAAGMLVLAGAAVALTRSGAGFPLVHVLVSLALVPALAALIFWFAGRQQAIDQQYGHFEN
jgi:hypothetical protein